MVKNSDSQIIRDLKNLSSEMQTYQLLQLKSTKTRLNAESEFHKHKMRLNALKNMGKLRGLITEITGIEKATTIVQGQKHSYDLWHAALGTKFDRNANSAIYNCLDLIQSAIGKLEDDIKHGKRDPETGEIIKSKQQREAEIDLSNSIAIFNAMQFHPKVVEASKACFTAGNYREAILNAFIALIDYVKEKTKLTTDTKDLMAKAFNIDNPVIKLNSLKEPYERDEQEGFRFLYMGAVVGIRNPKAHKLIPQSNPLYTLEYLAFASLLMRRVEEGELAS